jgi:transcriptional regulator with XRE-family HTH domain
MCIRWHVQIFPLVHDMYMSAKRVRPRPKVPLYGPHFLRQWREYRGKTLEEVGEAVGISHAQLGRIERRLQKYNQELLEALAELYQTDAASLIMRDPTDEDAIWSLWDQAKEGQRQEIKNYMAFVVKSRTGT